VEYESRRDADDAYHEMHNKRIGRDDLLKIEVSIHYQLLITPRSLVHSGLALLRLLPGALTLAVTLPPALSVEVIATVDPAVIALLVVAVAASLQPVAEITLHARMTVETVTTSDATVRAAEAQPVEMTPRKNVSAMKIVKRAPTERKHAKVRLHSFNQFRTRRSKQKTDVNRNSST
jgi:hypothetical protein